MFVKRTLDKDKNSKIRIVGIDNFGNNVIDNLHNVDYHKIVITPNTSDAYGIPDTKLIIGYNVNDGLIVGNNEKLSKEIFEESKKEIKHLLINWSEYNTEDTIIFIGGGPDFLSNIVMPSIIELNKKIVEYKCRKTFVIVAKPFKYEGQKIIDTFNVSIAKLKELEKSSFFDKLIVVNVDNLFNSSASIFENWDLRINAVCKEVYNIIETL